MGPGFFLEHGRPEIGISDLKPVVFWPDEWERVQEFDFKGTKYFFPIWRTLEVALI